MNAPRTAFALALALAAVTAGPVRGAAQARIPVGTYEMVPDSNYTAGFDVAGLLLEFTDSTMTGVQMGNVLVKATLSYAGDAVTLTDTEGSVACPSAGTYKVAVTPKGVRLTVVSDACDGRMAVLGQVTLVRKV